MFLRMEQMEKMYIINKIFPLSIFCVIYVHEAGDETEYNENYFILTTLPGCLVMLYVS